MESLGSLLSAGVEFLGIWALFSRFGSIGGWTLAEVALFYGLVHVVFAVAEAIGRGFDLFGPLIKEGAFDRVLLRPRSTTLQVLGSNLAPKRIGRLLQGAVVLGWALTRLDGGPTAGDLALLGVGVPRRRRGVLRAAHADRRPGVLDHGDDGDLRHRHARRRGDHPVPDPGVPPRPPLPVLFLVPIATVTYFPVVRVLGRPDPLGAPAASPGSHRWPGSSSWFWSPASGSSASATTPRPVRRACTIMIRV